MRCYFIPVLIPPLYARLIFINLVTLLLLLFILSISATAAQVTLAWDPNTESNLAGYNLYYKVGSPGSPYEGSGLDQGNSHIFIALESLSDRNNPSFTVSGLPEGETFYFVVSACSSDGDESLFSNEIYYQATIPIVPVETFTITVLPQDGGTISPEGSAVFAAGSDQVYTAVAADNYHLVDFLVDEISVGVHETYTFASLDSDHTITAIFVLDSDVIEEIFESTPGAPLANAGPDQNVEEVTETILDGSNSIDLNDEIVSYHWEQISGSQVDIMAADSCEAGFVTPMPGFEGEALEFCLTVTDSAGNQSSDYCVINVVLDNSPPMAEAGYEQIVAEGVLVQLDGADSFDPDDGISNYQWTQVAGKPVELSSDIDPTPTFFAPEVDSPEGTSLVFNLMVTDTGGLKACDSCIVNVSWSNEPPVADAGCDQEVFGGGTITLDGSGSYDNDDAIYVYHWTQSKGMPVSLSDPTAMQPCFTTPEAGSAGALLSFRLTVTDNHGLQSQAECLVEIMPEVVDVIPPYLAIQQPYVVGVYTIKSSSVSVSGEALDNVEVALVKWSNDLGGEGVASGTEQWSIGRVRLKKGYNTITVTAIDTAGNSTDEEIVIYRQ